MLLYTGICFELFHLIYITSLVGIVYIVCNSVYVNLKYALKIKPQFAQCFIVKICLCLCNC